MSTHCKGLQFLSDQVNEQLSNDEVDVFLKLYLLLYDDTVVFAESQTGLQTALNCMLEYCKLSHLTVSTDKIEDIVFSRGKLRNKPVFYFNNAPLEAVDDFSYLGVISNLNGNLIKQKST
jgi:hypothetical protein